MARIVMFWCDRLREAPLPPGALRECERERKLAASGKSSLECQWTEYANAYAGLASAATRLAAGGDANPRACNAIDDASPRRHRPGDARTKFTADVDRLQRFASIRRHGAGAVGQSRG